jgi:hypothetical protein
MGYLLACGVCGYWIAWSGFPPVTFWVLVFAGWFLGLSAVRSFGQAAIPGTMRLGGALLALSATALVSVLIGGPFVALWLPPACLAGAVALFRLEIWAPARSWARPVARWLSMAAVLLLAFTAAFEQRRAGRLSPAQRVLLTESTPAADIELKRIEDCAPLQEVIRGAAQDRRLVEKTLLKARQVCEPAGLERFLTAEAARIWKAGEEWEWKAEALER